MVNPKIKRLYVIPILCKALDILEQLEKFNAPVALEDLFQLTNISKTSVYRILKTYEHRGYVAHGQDGRYRLVSRPRRLRFGYAAQSAELPFSVSVGAGLNAAAASAGVELIQLDNKYDPDIAIENAKEFVRKRVDLVLEFQVEEEVAPFIASIFKRAEIPLIAIDVPHPNATYFGVDNYEAGYETGLLLAQYAQRNWKSKADWVLGVGMAEAGNFVQSRIQGSFACIRERLPNISSDRFIRLEGRGMRVPSQAVITKFLNSHAQSRNQRILVATTTDSSALGVLDAAREAGLEKFFAIAGQDCIPEVLDEMKTGKSAIIGSISHEADSYGPRLIQLGIALLRGYAVPPYNYVHHHAITPETLESNLSAGD